MRAKKWGGLPRCVFGASLRPIFIIANRRNYIIVKFDVKTGNRSLNEKVSMNIPEEYEDSGKIC